MSSFFFFNATATTEIYTLSLHDALPNLTDEDDIRIVPKDSPDRFIKIHLEIDLELPRSEEHTSELQSLTNLVCRLLLEKKKIVESKTSTQRKTLGSSSSAAHQLKLQST